MLPLLIDVRARTSRDDPSVVGFNVGVNDGGCAGQPVPHCHWCLIPRRNQDVDGPRGGVRNVILGRVHTDQTHGCYQRCKPKRERGLTRKPEMKGPTNKETIGRHCAPVGAMPLEERGQNGRGGQSSPVSGARLTCGRFGRREPYPMLIDPPLQMIKGSTENIG